MTIDNDDIEPSKEELDDDKDVDSEELEEAVPEEDVPAEDLQGDDGDDDAADGDDDDGAGGSDEEALDELEAEELEMLTEDEASETIVPDEAAEMRAIRRAEIAMDREEASEAGEDEFVCVSCYLVKRVSQLANPRKKICLDCAG